MSLFKITGTIPMKVTKNVEAESLSEAMNKAKETFSGVTIECTGDTAFVSGEKEQIVNCGDIQWEQINLLDIS